jgi:hypothetical protein
LIVLLRIGIALLLLSVMVGCSSSQPVPQPLSSGPRLTQEQAAQVIKNAEAQQPCSALNLKNASEAQKRTCDPTIGMFDNIKPTQTAASPPKAQKRQNAKQATN